MGIWVWVLMIFLIAFVKLLVTCPPTFIVDWFVSKFEVHPKLSNETATVDINGERLDGEEKIQVINEFNEAIFLQKYYVHPKKSGTPLIINTKIGKKNARLFVYIYNDHVDVFKHDKKKIIAYKLLSEGFQKRKQFFNVNV
ncbi:YfmQ family protein [Heyndrickxia ginsengihumi]|uniref:YfmQ n=1 Tax=Heyndrickxia ginsengihumi TaxID=363870 RepID=A0A6M0P4E6_9BACI|nr:YfmQ family protein [Heyndrickxia ginsengihumi]MBE6184894.1 hypothetical protein [Bacillus sp. (in: firmicutes)]MCM3024551.1 YfmQ family protein [Heyndrickxia ginsengihumi]NEY18760.1 hypothetical protein [Heyndrickxia ginsengihumi]